MKKYKIQSMWKRKVLKYRDEENSENKRKNWGGNKING